MFKLCVVGLTHCQVNYMELINFAKLGMELLAYLAVFVFASITFRPDLAFVLLSELNILLYTGCFRVLRANFLHKILRLFANGSRLSIAKLQK